MKSGLVQICKSGVDILTWDVISMVFQQTQMFGVFGCYLPEMQLHIVYFVDTNLLNVFL